jgi:hypothetical protein
MVSQEMEIVHAVLGPLKIGASCGGKSCPDYINAQDHVYCLSDQEKREVQRSLSYFKCEVFPMRHGTNY